MDEYLHNEEKRSFKDEVTNSRRGDYCKQTWMDDTMNHFEEKDVSRSTVPAPEVHQHGGDFNPILHLKAARPRPDGSRGT
jgi:hypothetical protein